MARTNVFVNLIPVFTAILSYFIIHEKFGLTKIAGILVVVAGLSLQSGYSHATFTSCRMKWIFQLTLHVTKQLPFYE